MSGRTLTAPLEVSPTEAGLAALEELGRILDGLPDDRFAQLASARARTLRLTHPGYRHLLEVVADEPAPGSYEWRDGRLVAPGPTLACRVPRDD